MDFTLGKAMDLGEVLGNGFPAPQMFTVLPSMVIKSNGVSYQLVPMSITEAGQLTTGVSNLAFQDRVIINASYLIKE